MPTSSESDIKNSSVASFHDNMNDYNSLSPNLEKNIRQEVPSDVLQFSNMSHELLWKSQEEGYDNLMKNSYFSLSNKAIEHSRKNDINTTPQEMLRQMKAVAGERNVPHFLNYPSEDSDGTISNQMIKERNFQKYMENPTKVRDMIADAFLLKIANDGSISELDREELMKEAENGKDSAELHDMMARMSYNNPKAYQAFHHILLDSEMIYKKIKEGENYGFVSDTYNKHYEQMAEEILKAKDSYANAEFYEIENERYIRNEDLEGSVTEVLVGKDINAISKIIDIMKNKAKLLNKKQDEITIKTSKIKRGSSEELSLLKEFNENLKIEDFQKIQKKIEDVYDFSNAHDANQKAANEILYEMHQSGRFDQNPYAFLDIPEVGSSKDDGTLFTKEDVEQEIEYNSSLIRKAINEVFGDTKSTEEKQEISKKITNDLYFSGDKIGNKKGAYYDAVKHFVKKAQNDPMTMTVYSELNSVATTIMRDAIYNELMEQELKNKNNSIYQDLKAVGSNYDKGKTVHISEKLKTGSYLESLSQQSEVKDEVATLMNKATLFGKVAKGEINAEQTENIIDKTAIFRDMKDDEKDAIKDVTNDIFDAKNKINMSEYYNIDSESRSRFLDDVVTNNVFGYIENVDDVMMPGLSRFFRNNKALANFGRCGQSGSVKDRNAESVANNLKGCMETYKQEIESGKRESVDTALKTLNTPFGSMNGILVFFIILEQLITDSEYRRTKKALSDMHHDILNKLAFRRASPDLQTEKARAAILSADANRGVTTTTIAHAVADKYKDSLRKEKLASTIFKESMDGRNIFQETKIKFPELNFNEEEKKIIADDLVSLKKKREQLKAQLSLLQDKVSIVRKASLINIDSLTTVAENTYSSFERVEIQLKDEPDNKALIASRQKILENLKIIKEQRDIVHSYLKMTSENFDPIEESREIEQTIKDIEKEINIFETHSNFFQHDVHELEDISKDNMTELMVKSKILKTMAEDIAKKQINELSKKDKKTLQQITESRELIATAMLKKGSKEGNLEFLRNAIEYQFGKNIFDKSERSGTQKSIEALGLDNLSDEVFKIIENADNGYDEVLYRQLVLKIQEGKGDKKISLESEQDKALLDTLKALNKEIDRLQHEGGDIPGRQLKARQRDKDRLIDYMQNIFIAREIQTQSQNNKVAAEDFIDELQKSDNSQVKDLLKTKNKKLIENFDESHSIVFENAKKKMQKISNELITSALDEKKDIVHEARSTGYTNKINEVVSALSNILSLEEAEVGNTHASIKLSNRINEIMSKNKKEYNDAILDAAGVSIREFVNKSQDNMSSMLLFTDERAVYLESARKTLEENGDIFQSQTVDKQLKNYISDAISYDVEGIESWGANAKNKEDILNNGISAQEGQRQTRSAMLR